MNPQDYFVRQSVFSDPGKFSALFDALPTDVESLCQIIHGIYLHHEHGKLVHYTIPKKRLQEMDLRYIEAILEKIIQLENAPLAQTRSPENRFIGNCRDSALLLCAMLRHQGIAARVRVGFADYFRFNGRNFYTGHVISECWNTSEARWVLVDPDQTKLHIQRNKIDFDVHDVPRNRFLVGGRAWEVCRRGEKDAAQFGVAPGDFFSGWWALRNRVVHELAFQNKVELLLWDTWNWMEYDYEPDSQALDMLDYAAALTQKDDSAFDEVQNYYRANDVFRAPKEVMSYSPTGDFKKVALRF